MIITIDDLINEGKSFKIETTPLHETIEGGYRVIHQPTSYIKNGDEYMAWIEKSKRFLTVNYPKDRAIDDFTAISKEGKNDTCLHLVAILVSLKEIPQICETPKDTPHSVQNINVNQSQNQTQNINIDIMLHSIQEEIGSAGIQSIKDIKGETEEEKKQNLLTKLKQLGENTLSNIVANILTNPTIWNRL